MAATALLQLRSLSAPVEIAAALAKDYQGRWIAGFAPVGNTGFVVVVQQRYDDAVSLESPTFWNLALWSAVVTCVALAIIVMLVWQWARTRKSPAS